MPKVELVAVEVLDLDLGNFRTVPKRGEVAAIEAMIAIRPDWFWALAESILASGYLPIENIIVLTGPSPAKKLVVKEGNRRVAIVKLALGQLTIGKFDVPEKLRPKFAAVTEEWKADNAKLPCTIYPQSEATAVDRIVTLAHGKGEKAGRDPWEAIARARHSRKQLGKSQPALDLLEKYLKLGQNITGKLKEKWAGTYPITVLEEAIKRMAPAFGVDTSAALVKMYPTKISHRDAVEQIVYEIGLGTLNFEKIRRKDAAFTDHYGITGLADADKAGDGDDDQDGKPADGEGGGGGGDGSKPDPNTHKPPAFPINDRRAVLRQLKELTPSGKGREKIVTLLNEAREMKLDKHAHAFCFVLRSLLELSAKAYCDDHKASGLRPTKADGRDKNLVDLLRDITNHMTNNQTDEGKKRLLHGAMVELGKPTNLASITSFNQLIHNKNFSVAEGDISIMFFNIFPLLAEMN